MLTRLITFVVLIACTRLTIAQHAHINAGAFGTEQDAQLYFPNGELFVTNSGYVVSLEPTNAGRFAGLYQGSITFTALPATRLTGGPAFGHAALGSFLELEIQSVVGPAKAKFGFWEAGDLQPRITIPVGTTGSTNRFALSEGDAAAGSDPFGHVHGRSFSATEPGLYSVAFQIVDTSRNGVGNGSIHTASEPFHLFFQAGFVAGFAKHVSNVFRTTFGTRTGTDYFLESTPRLNGSNEWTVVAGPATGNNRLQTLTDPNATREKAFYRLRRDPP